MNNINSFAQELYQNSRGHGFYEHEEELRRAVAESSALGIGQAFHETNLSEHFGNRLLLIAGEAVEAHEEVRSGRGLTEVYFSAGKTTFTAASDGDGNLLKPEGLLAELADVAIRTLETMAGILAQADYDEQVTLRARVPESEATEYNHESDQVGNGAQPVNVEEILLLKHRYNQSRAKFHGGRKF